MVGVRSGRRSGLESRSGPRPRSSPGPVRSALGPVRSGSGLGSDLALVRVSEVRKLPIGFRSSKSPDVRESSSGPVPVGVRLESPVRVRIRSAPGPVRSALGPVRVRSGTSLRPVRPRSVGSGSDYRFQVQVGYAWRARFGPGPFLSVRVHVLRESEAVTTAAAATTATALPQPRPPQPRRPQPQ